MIINISDVWEDASSRHYVFLNNKIDDGLGTLSSSFIDMCIKDFVESNRKVIISGTPVELSKSIRDYEGRFGTKLLNECVKKRLNKIFNFDKFSEKSEKNWSAYQLCQLARYKVCCYCHINSTATSLPTDDEKGYRPPLDHYYIKSDYPFLALTLSNFIPCCEKCNGSQMKHSINFAKIPHLNPLKDAESIDFQIVPLSSSEEEVATALALQLPATRYCLMVFAKSNNELSVNSIKTFQLKSRYDEYSKQSYYLARKLRSFASRKEMIKDALIFEADLADLLEFEPQDYKNVAYGKARLCIAKQFGVLDD
ncbi:hypothetical protein [Siccibacter turicensis]|uniref:hypothetical protein n=1 Tax=Siccibacter turicensis TaxID=357233 RepID=UPI001021A81F|nr:hypothetical protein [Siccibacter turicensis]